MDYKVFRRHGQEIVDSMIAECVFYADAMKVLENWNSGYIVGPNNEIAFNKPGI